MLASNPSSALVAVVLLVGCATNTAPPRFLPNPVEAQTQAWGGWIEISYVENGAQRRAEGELIAVTRDSVWVLGTDGGAGAVVPTTQVRSGQLTAYDAQGGKVAGAAFLGTVSTISNGAFLILTAPLWIITGSVAASHQTHAPERSFPPLLWSELAAFARFPQGMPAGLRLGDLRPKAR